MQYFRSRSIKLKKLEPNLIFYLRTSCIISTLIYALHGRQNKYQIPITGNKLRKIISRRLLHLISPCHKYFRSPRRANLKKAHAYTHARSLTHSLWGSWVYIFIYTRENTHTNLYIKSQQTDLSAAQLSAGGKTRYDKLLRRPVENKFRRADETHNCVGLTGGKLQIAAIR